MTAAQKPPRCVRLSININEDAAAFYRALKSRGLTVTEAVRRATGVYKVVLEHVESGGTVVLRDPDGHDRELVLL